MPFRKPLENDTRAPFARCSAGHEIPTHGRARAALAPARAEISRPTITVQVGTSLASLTRTIILATVEHCGGRLPEASAHLGISKVTLYKRLKEYGAWKPRPKRRRRRR